MKKKTNNTNREQTKQCFHNGNFVQQQRNTRSFGRVIPQLVIHEIHQSYALCFTPRSISSCVYCLMSSYMLYLAVLGCALSREINSNRLLQRSSSIYHTHPGVNMFCAKNVIKKLFRHNLYVITQYPRNNNVYKTYCLIFNIKVT